jgi:ABC-type bacteriocin/lantibiotic exporter with double-glycine peptidase domain
MFTNDLGAAVILYWAFLLAFIALGILILWLIIRGAVLSALRQYRREGMRDQLE